MEQASSVSSKKPFGFHQGQKLNKADAAYGNQPAPTRIPATIFSYWDTGLASAPEIVQMCVGSWFSNSGAERVIVLDDSSLYEFLDPVDLPRTFTDLPPQKKANAIRLALLNRHGGVWLDASIYVRFSLFDWINEVASPGGLFVFRDPGPDRYFANWFLAAVKGHFLIDEIHGEYLRYFDKVRVHNFHIRPGNYSIVVWTVFKFVQDSLISKSKTLSQLWAAFPLNWLKFYPYFVFHYIANRALRKKRCKDSFRGMEYVPARLGLLVRHALRSDPQIEDFDKLLAGNPVPLQKLSSHRPLTPSQLSSLK